MNRENVQAAIDIMKRAGRVYMSFYHSIPTDSRDSLRTRNLGTTEEDLNACGAAACFAGWVSVSPEFKAAGGWPGIGGSPRIAVHGDLYGEYEGAEAIAHWLDIPLILANGLVFNEMQPGSSELFYGVDLEHVTREQVISKLEELLAQCEG